MKSSVTFLKSLLTSGFMLGNGFLSMFGSVCLYIWKWGDFILAKIPRRSACLSLFTPVLSWFVWWWVQRHFIALMGSYLVASFLDSYECLETVLTLIISEHVILQNSKYSWWKILSILWHLQRLFHSTGVWRAITLQRYTKVTRNLHSLLLFPGC